MVDRMNEPFGQVERPESAASVYTRKVLSAIVGRWKTKSRSTKSLKSYLNLAFAEFAVKAPNYHTIWHFAKVLFEFEIPTEIVCESKRANHAPSIESNIEQLALTFSSTIRFLIHSFSLLVSIETESMQRFRQKFRAPSQSSSTPRRAGSRHEKKYLRQKINRIKRLFYFREWFFNFVYPFPSGARSWMVRSAHSAGTGGSKIRPLGNWANAKHMTELKHITATARFIFAFSADFFYFSRQRIWKSMKWPLFFRSIDGQNGRERERGARRNLRRCRDELPKCNTDLLRFSINLRSHS